MNPLKPQTLNPPPETLNPVLEVRHLQLRKIPRPQKLTPRTLRVYALSQPWNPKKGPKEIPGFRILGFRVAKFWVTYRFPCCGVAVSLSECFKVWDEALAAFRLME